MIIIKNTVKHIFIFAFCLMTVLVNAQEYHAEARLDSNRILIGDHVNLHLYYSGNINSKVLFPIIHDTSFHGLEIIEYYKPRLDTINNTIIFKQQFTLTSFDSGTYSIPSILFYDNDSTLLATTQALKIQVNTLTIDTALAIKDIKPPLNAPLTLKEVLTLALISVSIIAFLVLIIVSIRRFKKKKIKSFTQKTIPLEPAHCIALRNLEALRLKKLWQQGEYKLYYSELTDILRIYLENRWGIQAMEMVSDEIIHALLQHKIAENLIQKVTYTLYHSDMVKFAKGQPLSDENQLCFDNIVIFVKETKVIEEKA
ncbi:MAG: hypothetical protein KBA86_05260 [Bacteroidales bacterium]|nr:hypothetical protein [Bacteroidales bacterium]